MKSFRWCIDEVHSSQYMDLAHQPVKFCANPIHSFEDMGI